MRSSGRWLECRSLLERRAFRWFVRAVLALALVWAAPRMAEAAPREVAVLVVAPDAQKSEAPRAVVARSVAASPAETPSVSFSRSLQQAPRPSASPPPQSRLFLAHCSLLI